MFVYRNYNPYGKIVGDCVVRAISTILDEPWDDIYEDLTDEGFRMKDMPSANSVWGAYLQHRGFVRYSLPDACPACYTVKNFCEDHPVGKFILATGTHVIAVIDGDYIDTWDSGDQVPLAYWERRR